MVTDTHHYAQLLQQVESILDNETDVIANMANLSSLLFHNISDLNWAGFYVLKNDELVLGPFQGQLACTRIALGKGVCGTAFTQKKTIVVEDVHQFEGHIACDAMSESEIVVPFSLLECQGVLDIDSPVTGRFGEQEKVFFENVVTLFERSTQ